MGGGAACRRRVLLGAAGAAVAGAAVTGRRGVAAASPAPANPRVRLVWAPWRVAWGKGWDAVFLEAVQPFLAANPGLDIVIDVSTGNGSNDAATEPQILAGTAPDVYSGYNPAGTIEGGYNLDLAPYLKEMNVDTGVFDAGQFAQYVYQGGVYALPAELSTSAVAVNEGTLDGLGLPYPDPEWDYGAAAQFWTRATVRSGTPSQQQTGYVHWGQYAAWLPGDFYLRGFGASVVTSEYAPTCGLSTPAAQTFAAWWFPLVLRGAIVWLGAAPSWPSHVVSTFAGSWQLPQYAALRSTKWSFWPQPAWPTGTSAYAGGDYYAVPRTSRHPREAVAFAVWLTTDVQWQHSLMALQLVVPPSSKLWGAWVDTVEAIAPPLQGKNVQAFMTAAQQGRAFADAQFAYASGAAYRIIGQYLPRIAAGQESAAAGMAAATQAVDALEQGQAELIAHRQAYAQAFPANGPTVAPVPAGI